jgi:septum formation inhibitor MinC
MIVDEQTKTEPLPHVPAQPFLGYRTLRSGTLLRTNGDTVIFGDVHHGAVIESPGNVTILGKLLGSVYVPEDRFVMAHDFRPLQVRFGHVVFTASRLEEESTDGPVIARYDGEIDIQPYHQQEARTRS